MASRRMEMDGVSIHYTVHGKGKHPLLLISGVLGTTDDWTSFTSSLPLDRYTVVAVDMPGYGKSRPPDRIINREANETDARIALHVMETLSLCPFVAVGWSEGGRTALRLAHMAGDRCTAVVETGAPVTVNRDNYDLFHMSSWPKCNRDMFVKGNGVEYTQMVWDQLVELTAQTFHAHDGKYAEFYLLPSIAQPVLVLHGELDVMCDPNVILDQVPNCRLEVRRGARHDVHTAEAEWFNIIVQEFLASILL